MYRVDDRYIIDESHRYVIEFAIRSDGKTIPALDFYQGSLTKKEQIQFDAFCSALSEHGYSLSHKHSSFRSERYELYSYRKTSEKSGEKKLIRFPCFQKDNRWIFTHGFWKPLIKSKWPEAEFVLAFTIKEEVIKRESIF